MGISKRLVGIACLSLLLDKVRGAELLRALRQLTTATTVLALS